MFCVERVSYPPVDLVSLKYNLGLLAALPSLCHLLLNVIQFHQQLKHSINFDSVTIKCIWIGLNQ